MKKKLIRGISLDREKFRKIWLTMRLIVVLFFVSLIHVSASVYSQKTKLNIRVENASLQQVFKVLQEQSEFDFFYKNEQIPADARISIQYQNESIEVILDKILSGTGLTYHVLDKDIVITTSGSAKSEMNLQQQKSVSGKVTDSAGGSLPGVSVVVKGTTSGTITDAEGNFSLSNILPDGTLVFSFVGMKSQEILVEDKSSINVVMQEETVGVDEVVVIGYGTQKKSNLTAAVQMVDTKDLKNRPVASIADMLTGSVPNLNITINSSAPNREPDLNIRGFTGLNSMGAPLVLVDGVEQDIKFVNANDVESISVLKDAASSAIYGSRAPNGVIIIITKLGKKGEKMHINFQSDLRSSQYIYPKGMNSLDYALLQNEETANLTNPMAYPQATIDRIIQYRDGILKENNITLSNGLFGGPWDANNYIEDFNKEALKSHVFNTASDLSISGGDNTTRYYASLGNVGNNGILKSDYDYLHRYSSVLKVSTEITQWLSMGVNLKYSRDETAQPRITTVGTDYGTLFRMIGFRPTIPAYNPNGAPNEFSIIPNITGLNGTYNTTIDNYMFTYNFELKPIKGLNIKADYTWKQNKQFDMNTSFIVRCLNADGITYTNSRRSSSYDGVEERSSMTNYHTANASISYNNTIKKHDFLVMAGYNEELNRYNNLYASNTDFYSKEIPTLSTSYGSNQIVDDTFYSWATRGYFGRLSYNYNGIYLFDFNGRYDASSKYSPDTRWSFFPSVSFGYNLAQEKFWPLKDYVNTFKIRGSWGKLGNNAGGNYTYLPTLTNGLQTPVILEGTRPPYVDMPGILSPDLTWTKPRSIGFGFDAGALANRLSFEYDWYQRTIFDQIGPAEQSPEVLGTNPPQRNNAISETRGWEFSLSWRDRAFNLLGSPVKYSIKTGLSDYIGYVVKYSLSGSSGSRSLWTPGQIFGQLYGYYGVGIAQNADMLQSNTLQTGWFYPGDYLFKDTNGDGRIGTGDGSYWYSQGDLQLLGYTYPRYNYNITLNASWKGLTLFALFNGVGKWTMYVNDKTTFGNNETHFQFQKDLGYWNFYNQNAFFPRTYGPTKSMGNVNEQYALNLAHLRIKNINLTYDLPNSLINKINLNSLSITISAENLGMIYYKSWNKQMDPLGYESTYTYPPSKTFSIGFKIGI